MLHILCKRAQIVTRLSIARVNITRRSYNATSPRYGSQKVPLQSRVASKKTQKNVRKSLRIEHEKEKGAGEHASTIELRRSGSQDILHKEPTTELHDAQVTKTPVAKPARKPRSRKADVTAKASPKVKDLMRHPRRHADRINIVSTGLCDDIIERLMPWLKTYKGCDMIDLSPGIGTWSEKCHQALKPANHILVEHEPELFAQYLQDLLQRRGTKLIRGSAHPMSQMDEILSHLCDKPTLANEESEKDGLIIMANLASVTRRPTANFTSSGLLTLYHLLHDTRARLFSKGYKRVRCLVWLHRSDIHCLLPKTISSRQTFAMLAETVCKHITLVTQGAEPITRTRRAGPLSEFRYGASAYQKMQTDGVAVPAGRETQAYASLRLVHEGSMSEEEFWQQHLLTCAQEAKTDRLPCIDPDTQRLNSKYASLVNQRSRQRKRLAHTKVLYGHVIPELESIDRAAKAISQLADADEKARRTLQLEVRTRNAYVWGEMLPYPFHGDISRWLDEHCASKGKPPVLYRNRRPYEPLKMHVDEFHPNNETECRPGLVEFELEPRLPLQLENDVEHRQIFERLTRIMNDRGGTLTLKKALGPFVGAYEWLVPRCPSLTDPARGGQWSIDRLSTRCLSMEMMLELTHAWVEWPFKPDRSTLLR